MVNKKKNNNRLRTQTRKKTRTVTYKLEYGRSPSEITFHRLLEAKKEHAAYFYLKQFLRKQRARYHVTSRSTLAFQKTHFFKHKVCLASPHRDLKRSLQDQVLWYPDYDSQLRLDYAPSLFEINCQHRDALQLAAELGSAKIVKILLQIGFDPNYRNSMGETALHCAAKHNHNEVIKLLVHAGAKINLLDECGFSAKATYFQSASFHSITPDAAVLKILTHQNYKFTQEGNFQNPIDQLQYQLQMKYHENTNRFSEIQNIIAINYFTMINTGKSIADDAFVPHDKEMIQLLKAELTELENISRKNLSLLICEDSIIFYLFHGIASTINSISEKTKRKMHSQIPWESLGSLHLLRIYAKESYSQELVKNMIAGIKEFSVIINRLEIEESDINQSYPIRDKALIHFHNITDFIQDYYSLTIINAHLTELIEISLDSVEGRLALIRVICLLGDLSKYSHSGRHLTQTIKSRIPEFPWHTVTKLRNKLAKIPRSSNDLAWLKTIFNNDFDIDMLVEIKKTLVLLQDRLPRIIQEHLDSFKDLSNYYQNEPLELVPDSFQEDVIEFQIPSNDVPLWVKSTQFIIGQKKQLLKLSELISKLVKIQNNHTMPQNMKEEQMEKLSQRIEAIKQLLVPYETILNKISSTSKITPQEIKLLTEAVRLNHKVEFDRLLNLEKRLIKSPILQLNDFLDFNEVSYKEMSLDQQFNLANFTRDILEKLADYVTYHEDQKWAILHHDFYKITRDPRLDFARIKKRFFSDQAKTFAFEQLSAYATLCLNHIFNSGNRIFRTHLEHNMSNFKVMAPERKLSEIKEVISYIQNNYLDVLKEEEKIVALRNEVTVLNLGI